jgi:hypothetical protein
MTGSTLDMIEVDPSDIRRDRTASLRAYGVERRHHPVAAIDEGVEGVDELKLELFDGSHGVFYDNISNRFAMSSQYWRLTSDFAYRA